MNLLRLVQDVLRGRAAVPDFAGQDEHISHCGCVLEEACWGSDGWHYHLATLQTMDRRERFRFAAERPGWSVSELRKAYGAWWRDLDMAGQLDSEGIPSIWKPYLGQPFAFEPCPAYRAKVVASLETEAAKKAPRRRAYEKPANASWSAAG